MAVVKGIIYNDFSRALYLGSAVAGVHVNFSKFCRMDLMNLRVESAAMHLRELFNCEYTSVVLDVHGEN